MKIKASSGGTWILWVFVVVGCLLMCGGIAVAISFAVGSRNYVEIPATITDITVSRDSDGDTHYYVTVDYEYNGVQYTDIPTGFWVTGMYEGQVINIFCHKDNPTQLQDKTFWIMIPCVFFGMGALFTLVSAFPLHKKLVQNRGSRYALKHGEVLHCKITDVKVDISYRVNGHPVNNIAYCVPLNEENAMYESLPFSRKYSVAVGSTVKLYRDRNNHANYYVDLNTIEPPTFPQDNEDVITDAERQNESENNVNVEQNDNILTNKKENKKGKKNKKQTNDSNDDSSPEIMEWNS